MEVAVIVLSAKEVTVIVLSVHGSDRYCTVSSWKFQLLYCHNMQVTVIVLSAMEVTVHVLLEFRQGFCSEYLVRPLKIEFKYNSVAKLHFKFQP